MKPEVTTTEIQAVMEPLGQNAACIEARAAQEGWEHSACGNSRYYIVDLLPEDIKSALKTATQPIIQEDKLQAIGFRRDQKVYHEQEERAFAKAELAQALISHTRQAPHGQKKKQKRLFLENYNLGAAGLLPEVFKLVGKVDLKGKTVDGWITKLKKNNWEPMCLAGYEGLCQEGQTFYHP